jgi:hypothetical protein
MTVNDIYLIVVIGLGLICIVAGFISGPNRFKKPVPVSTIPAGNMGGKYVSFDYHVEKQNFLNALGQRTTELKPNQGEDYRQEKERRDVVAFFEYCKAGLIENLNNEASGQ